MITPAPPTIPMPVLLDKDFVCRQILEISDKARECGNLVIALEGMAIIAAILGMLDESDSF